MISMHCEVTGVKNEYTFDSCAVNLTTTRCQLGRTWQALHVLLHVVKSGESEQEYLPQFRPIELNSMYVQV